MNCSWCWTKFLPPDAHAVFAVVRGGRLRVLCDNTRLPDGRMDYWTVVERLESVFGDPTYPLPVKEVWLTHPHECYPPIRTDLHTPEEWKEELSRMAR